MKQKIIAQALLILSLHTLQAQSLNNVNLTNILPPSPDVAALGKFLSMDIGYSTGTPNISIPIYTVVSGDLSLPVSLSYNASGIKVTEAPTWVGLGWNLQAGGSVSRVVRGLPDDLTTNGYMNTTKRISYIDSLAFDSPERFDIYDNYIGTNVLDVEPDVFFFSVMGYSGRFYFDQLARTFVLTPYQNIKIDYQTDANNRISQWIITLPSGVKCYFGNTADNSRPMTEQSGVMTNYTLANGVISSSPVSVGTHNTAWPIAQILAPSGRTIDFYYQSLSAIDFGRGGETMSYDMAGSHCLVGLYSTDKRQTASFYQHAYTKPLLTRISTDLCDVKFIASTVSRQDMAGDDRSLDTIVVKDKNNLTIKRFDLSYSYSRALDTLLVNPMGVVDSIAQKRLVLNKFSEVTDDHSQTIPYFFTYNSLGLPSRLSASQDYWGYYNGKSNGEYLSPKVTVAAVRGAGTGYETGVDRTVDGVKAQAGMLTKIRYPTGGTTSYTYESNKAIAGFAGPELAQFQLSGLIAKSVSFGNGIYGAIPVDGVNYHFVDTFTIHNISGQAQLVSACDGCSTVFSTSCPLNGTLRNLSNSFNLTINEAFTGNYTLDNGTYVLSLDVTPNASTPSPNFHIVFSWNENPDLSNLIAGGLRVKSIISDDSLGGAISRSYAYASFADTSQSSGYIYNLPVSVVQAPCGDESSGTVAKVQSSSAIPIFSIDGNLIRYKNITEYYDKGGISYKTEYTYSVDQLFDASPYGTNYPQATPVQSDWRSGLLSEKKDYESLADGGYRPVKDEQYFYKSFLSISKDAFGIKIAPYDNGSGAYFGITPYSFKTEWYLPDSTYTAMYSYPSGTPNPVINASSVKSYYNSRYFVTMTRRINSKGETIDEHRWYPFEFGSISGFNFSQLTANYILENPVKQEISNNGKITSGQVIKHNTQGKPLAVYAYESNQAGDTAAFSSTSILTANYNQKASIGYDNLFNVSQVTPQGKYPTSYIWDYKNNYPIAQVKNTAASTMAYTSFESDGAGNWIIPDTGRNRSTALTGSCSYNLSTGKTISASGLSTGATYIVSYWSNSGLSVNGSSGTAGTVVGSWTYYEHQLTGVATISITGNATIDELRLYPKGSLMTTFTYAPLIGMTSQCSPTNYVTYYNYDGLRRLAAVKDMRGNIIRTTHYNYHK